MSKRPLFYLVSIYLLLVAISFFIQSSKLTEFNGFFEKIDFCWEGGKSFVGDGWEVKLRPVPLTEIQAMAVTSAQKSAFLYFNLPQKDAYTLKLYLRFGIPGQKISLYVNNEFISFFQSSLEFSGEVEDFYIDLPPHLSQKGQNILKIINHNSEAPIVIEQIKIKNYRFKKHPIYILLDSSNASKTKPLFLHKLLISFAVGILLWSFLMIYAIFLKSWLKVSIIKILKRILTIIFTFFIVIFTIYLLIYLSSYFSKYIIMIDFEALKFYLTLLGLCVVFSPRKFYLKLITTLPGYLMWLVIKICQLLIKIVIYLTKLLKKFIVNFNQWLVDGGNFRLLIYLILVFIFLLAFFSRYSFYLEHSYVTTYSFGTQNDSEQYIFWGRNLAQNFKEIFRQRIEHTAGAEISLTPFLAFLFKYWGILPGLHYYGLIITVLSALVCLMPYFIISSSMRNFSLGGLVAGFFLAIHPVLIEETPRIMSDTYTLVIFSFYLFIYYKTLVRFNIFYLVILGLFSFYLINCKLIFVVIVPILLFFLFLTKVNLLHLVNNFFKKSIKKEKLTIAFKKATLPFLIFIILFGIEELIVYNLHRSTALGFIYRRQGLLLKAVIRNSESSKYYLSNLKLNERLHRSFTGFKEKIDFILFGQLTKNFKWIVLLFVLYTVIMIWKEKLLYLPWILTFSFLLIIFLMILPRAHIISPGAPQRHYLLVIFTILLGLGFFIDTLLKLVNERFKMISIEKIKLFKIYLLALLLFFIRSDLVKLPDKTFQLLNNKLQEKKYLNWVKEILPQEAIIVIDQVYDPELTYRITKKSVVYNIRYKRPIYIDKIPYFPKDYKELTNYVDIQGRKRRGATTTQVLLGFMEDGKKLFAIDNYTIRQIKHEFLRKGAVYPINNEKFELVLFRKYKTPALYREIYQLKKK
jgi:hypothetical protein